MSRLGPDRQHVRLSRPSEQKRDELEVRGTWREEAEPTADRATGCDAVQPPASTELSLLPAVVIVIGVVTVVIIIIVIVIVVIVTVVASSPSSHPPLPPLSSANTTTPSAMSFPPTASGSV